MESSCYASVGFAAAHDDDDDDDDDLLEAMVGMTREERARTAFIVYNTT